MTLLRSAVDAVWRLSLEFRVMFCVHALKVQPTDRASAHSEEVRGLSCRTTKGCDMIYTVYIREKCLSESKKGTELK